MMSKYFKCFFLGWFILCFLAGFFYPEIYHLTQSKGELIERLAATGCTCFVLVRIYWVKLLWDFRCTTSKKLLLWITFGLAVLEFSSRAFLLAVWYTHIATFLVVLTIYGVSLIRRRGKGVI